MEFKTLFLKNNHKKDLIKPEIKTISKDFNITEIDEYDSRFICLRLERIQDAGKYGVMSNSQDKSISLKEELNNRPIYIQDFIVIDKSNQDIYYTGSKASVELILKQYYGINNKDIASRISIDNLAEISAIKVKEYVNAQMDLFSSNENPQIDCEISSLFTDSDPFEFVEHNYKLVRSSLFSKDKLKKLLEDSLTSKTKRFTIDGKDLKGNLIKYSDGFFAKKYEIFPLENYNEYSVRKSLTLKEITDELRKVIE